MLVVFIILTVLTVSMGAGFWAALAVLCGSLLISLTFVRMLGESTRLIVTALLAHIEESK